MNLKNVEFKARVTDLQFFEDKLTAIDALYLGSFVQKDTYFNATTGRLKLREYEDYSSLIYYDRDETSANKLSKVIYYQHETNKTLLEILKIQMGVKVYVEKVRKLFKKNNVSIHLDIVEGLGIFIEVEACDEHGLYSTIELEEQCANFLNLFELVDSDLIAPSYSDLLLATLK